MRAIKAINKYLSLYAEAEIHSLEQFPTALVFQTVLVIPVYKEKIDFAHRLKAKPFIQQKRLFIIVINQPDADGDEARQWQLSLQLQQLGEKIWQKDNLLLLQITASQSHFLLVDRFSDSRKIPSQQGVGLARKIGCDLAVALLHKQQLISHWIASSDADVLLPDAYFSAIEKLTDPATAQNSAAIFDFEHIDSKDIEITTVDTVESDNHLTDIEKANIFKATHLYEQALGYYVDGLSWAGSSYAFYTIGSLLAINIHRYCLVRGFPKRAAGEDFYLLNKLAKVGEIKKIQQVKIQIYCRLSDRVPFGTGPMVQKMLSLPRLEDFSYYHPQVFMELKMTLTFFGQLWTYRDDMDTWKAHLSNPTKNALVEIKFFNFLLKLKMQLIDEKQFNRQLLEWFDAFKTLKYLNHLRDNEYGQLTINTAIEKFQHLKDTLK